MQAINYENYSERKLYNALEATRSTLKKLQTEQTKIAKKINEAIQKQNEIKSVLAIKLNEPNEATIKAIQDCEKGENSGVVLNSFDELNSFHRQLKLEVANEN